MIENWKHGLSNGKKGGNILVDLSKPFDTLNHNLLLNAYGFSFNAIKFV